MPLKTGQIPNVRPGRASSTIRAPCVVTPVCRPGPGDTGMSLGGSLLKLLTSALRSRKRLSPAPFRSRLWTTGSLASCQYTVARTPTHSFPARRMGSGWFTHKERWMSLLTAVPEELAAAAAQLTAIVSSLTAQNAGAAAATTGVAPAAADSVSLQQAGIFSAYGTLYQQLASEEQTIQEQFATTLGLTSGPST